jgi:hypothetical protein
MKCSTLPIYDKIALISTGIGLGSLRRQTVETGIVWRAEAISNSSANPVSRGTFSLFEDNNKAFIHCSILQLL